MEKKLTVLLLLIVENRLLNNSTGDILSVYEQLKIRITVYIMLYNIADQTCFKLTYGLSGNDFRFEIDSAILTLIN